MHHPLHVHRSLTVPRISWRKIAAFTAYRRYCCIQFVTMCSGAERRCSPAHKLPVLYPTTGTKCHGGESSESVKAKRKLLFKIAIILYAGQARLFTNIQCGHFGAIFLHFRAGRANAAFSTHSLPYLAVKEGGRGYGTVQNIL